MNSQEQKRLRELAERCVQTIWDGTLPPASQSDDVALIEAAILAAIEPYRAALVSARNLLEKAPVRDGYLMWRTARAEHSHYVNELLGEPAADGYHKAELPR